jgi:hypothetical protein
MILHITTKHMERTVRKNYPISFGEIRDYLFVKSESQEGECCLKKLFAKLRDASVLEFSSCSVLSFGLLQCCPFLHCA